MVQRALIKSVDCPERSSTEWRRHDRWREWGPWRLRGGRSGGRWSL